MNDRRLNCPVNYLQQFIKRLSFNQGKIYNFSENTTTDLILQQLIAVCNQLTILIN